MFKNKVGGVKNGELPNEFKRQAQHRAEAVAELNNWNRCAIRVFEKNAVGVDIGELYAAWKELATVDEVCEVGEEDFCFWSSVFLFIVEFAEPIKTFV